MMASLSDKKFQYFGSSRFYGSGVALGSTTAVVAVTFSGTNTHFGSHGNELSQRVMIASSGTSIAQVSFDGGTSFPIKVYPGDSITFDGLGVSGLDIRSNTASQLVRVFAW